MTRSSSWLALAAASHAKGFSGLAHAEKALPEIRVDVGTARAALAQASLAAESGTLRWRVSGDAVAESLTANFAKGAAGVLKLARTEIGALQANEPLRFAR